MSIALWAAGLGIGGALVAVLWVVARQAFGRWRDRRLLGQASRVRALLAEARAREFEGLDKLLFDMRDIYDAEVIEGELSDALRTTGHGTEPVAARLIHAFSVLGITGRYLTAVRAAHSWQQRALAATMLGMLGEVRAIKPLVEALHDPREDADVKLACAETLGRIRDPSVIPILIAELERVDEWSSPRIAAVLIAFGELAVEPLLGALASTDSLNVRVWSVQVLGKLGDRRAVPALLARIHDRADAFRMSVVNALGSLGDARAVRPLIDTILRDPSPMVRAQAAAALGRIRDAASLPLLVAALGDLEHWVRLRALEAIEAMAPSDTSAIEVALDDQNREVRHRAALALERLGTLDQAFADLGSDDELRWVAARDRLVAVGRAGLSERLTRHLEDSNPRVRARVVAVLGALEDRSHEGSLIKRLGDPDSAVRLAAIAALGTLGATAASSSPAHPSAARALVTTLRDGSPEERAGAVQALLGYDRAELAAIATELTPIVEHARDEVRAAAIQVLAMIPGEAIDRQLRVALSDRFIDVRLTAMRALGKRRVTAAVDEIGDGLDAPIVPLQVAAADALGMIGGARAVQLLVTVMPRARGESRDAVCAALAGFGWDAAYPTFDVLLASDEIGTRLGAVWTLGKTGDPRAVPILHMLLHEPEQPVRSAAAGALGKIADPRAIAALVEALTDPSPFVRSAAVNALGGMNQPAPDVLVPLLADPDGFVRNRAVLALGRIGGEAADASLAAVTSDAVAPVFLAMARGLAGTEAGIATALRALQDKALRPELERLLADEPATLRQRFYANLNIDATTPPAQIDVDAIVGRYVVTLRNSSDVEARRTAARAIADASDEQSTAALALAVRHDPDHEVRFRAAASLAGRADGRARAALLGAVRDPERRVRLVAIRALARELVPREAGPLFDALATPEPEIVHAAEQALIEIHSASDALSIIQDWTMAQESEQLVCSGLRILAGIADSRSLRAVQALSRSSAPAIRLEAIRALAALGVPDAIRTMLGALNDPAAAVRVAVVRSLQRTTRADVIESLGRVADDPSADVRIAVCETVTTLDTIQAVPLLGKLATDYDVGVSAAAVLGLLSCSDVEGLARALAVLPSIVPEARRRVKQGIGEVPERCAALITGALDPALRETALKVLATIDATAHAERIARALEDPDGRVRLAAVQTLVTLEPERVGDWLERVYNDPVAEIRVAARRQPWKLV